MALFYNAPGRYLHIKTYRHGTPTGDDFNLGPNKDAPEIDPKAKADGKAAASLREVKKAYIVPQDPYQR